VTVDDAARSGGGALVDGRERALLHEPPAERAGLFERLRAWRTALFAKPTFQRWAAWFPLTRPVAQARAMKVFDLCAGFVYSQILVAAVEVDLLGQLRRGPLTAASAAAATRLPLDGALRLLQGCVALGLVERRRDGRFALGVEGALLLGNDGAMRMIAHHALLYRDLADPVALLRGEQRDTELRRFWDYQSGQSSPAAAYSTLMAGSVSLITEDILEAYPVAGHTRFLDVGGGEGAFIEAVCKSAPHLKATLFDLPMVAARARARLGPDSGVTVVGGDMFKDALPRGADLISLIRVVHDHDDDPALALLQAACAALEPGGTLLLAEPMAGTPGAERMGDAYFGFYLLAMGQGRPRTEPELRALLSAAGFVSVRRHRTRRPMLTGVLTARAPKRTP